MSDPIIPLTPPEISKEMVGLIEQTEREIEKAFHMGRSMPSPSVDAYAVIEEWQRTVFAATVERIFKILSESKETSMEYVRGPIS